MATNQSRVALCWPPEIKYSPRIFQRKVPPTLLGILRIWGAGGAGGSPSSPCAPEQVQAFDKKLEDMSNQVLQWQKQHQCDLKMLAAKEEQLRAFQEEMCALKENLLADEKEVGAPRLVITSSPKNIHSPPPRTSQDHRWGDRHSWVGLGAGVPGSKKRTSSPFSTKAGSGCSRPTAAVSTRPSSCDFIDRDIEQNQGPNPAERECHLPVRYTSSPLT